MSLCFCNHMRFGESITSVYQINSESSWSLHVVMLVPFSSKSSQQRSPKSDRLDRFYLEFKVSTLTSIVSKFRIEGWTEFIHYIYHFFMIVLAHSKLCSCLFTPICSLLCVFNHSHWWRWWPPQRTMGIFIFLYFKPCLVHAALLGVINRSGRNLCKPLAGTSVQQLAHYLCSQLASRHDSCLALVSLRWASTSVISSCSFF